MSFKISTSNLNNPKNKKSSAPCGCSAHNKSTQKVSKSKGNKQPKKGKPLDTIAQRVTTPPNSSKKAFFSDSDSSDVLDDAKLKATSKDNKKALTKRAKRMYLKENLSYRLIDINNAKRELLMENVSNVSTMFETENKDKDILRSYWNMYFCGTRLTETGGKLTGIYCKNRLCLVCNSIRTAVLVQKYKPVFDEWGDETYLVTLTAKTVDAHELDDRIDGMFAVFKKITNRIRKRASRGKSEKLEGLRKIECTHNSYSKKYHPHFHLMIKGEVQAKQVVKYWLELGRKEGWEMTEIAQDVRKASKGSEMELFKYFTKIISTQRDDKNIYVDSLDVIFKAFRGRRVFQNFGFKIPKIEKEDIKEVEDIQSPEAVKLNEIIEFLEDKKGSDYVSMADIISKMKGKKGLKELIEWVKDEKKSGLPFVEIKTLVELLEEMINDLHNVSEDKERMKIWSGSDWFDTETGEALTGYELSEALKDIASRMKIPSFCVDYVKKKKS